jgi:aspartate aminotransferase
MISKATSPRTKAVILNSPSNPTGAILDPEDLLVIGDMAQRRKFTLLYDDTYARLSYGRPDTTTLQALRDSVGDRFVVLGTVSKSYCMTGWRIGWLLGPRALVEASSVLISHSTQCPATFAQVGAVEALTGPQQGVQDLVAEYRRRRDFLHAALTQLPKLSCALPGGAFYLFPNLARYLSSQVPTTVALAARLDEQGLAGPRRGVRGAWPLCLSFARPLDELLVRRLTGVLPGPAPGE